MSTIARRIARKVRDVVRPMHLQTWIVETGRRGLGLDRALPDPDGFGSGLSAARARYGAAEGALAKLFFEHRGRLVDKWLHYLPVYERYLDPYRATDMAMMEIGVFRGGSLELWREYLGEDARIFGVDIDPACAELVDPPNQVRIGSQADPDFLRGVVAEMGRLDIVLDDGSHVAEHQRASFATLFPLLEEGGLYIIEDLHTAYWRGYWSGGYRRRGTAVEMVKTLIDDMHHWYHGRRFATAGKGQVAAIHVHDSIVVIEKARSTPPIRTQAGGAAA